MEEEGKGRYCFGKIQQKKNGVYAKGSCREIESGIMCLIGAAVAEQSLLGDMQLVNLGRHLRQQLLGLLEERQLGCHHIGQVAERLGLLNPRKKKT